MNSPQSYQTQAYRPGDAENSIPLYTVVNDQQYREIFTGGHEVENLRRYTARNRDGIELILRRRLAHLNPQLSMDNLWEPDGQVRTRTEWGQKLFAEATDDLAHGRWGDAATKFAQLGSEEVSGRTDSMLCQNYQAYALAKAGSFRTQLVFEELAVGRVKVPSAWWNYACCIPDSDDHATDRKLDILAGGLEHAPDPRLLAGAVTFAIERHVDHPRLVEWLCMLPFSEALLLAFDRRFDVLSQNSGDLIHAMHRLSEYAQHGDPLAPPTFTGWAKSQDMDAYVKQLTLQPEAAEFWLRCRELVDGSNFDFWQVKSDFLERQRRMPEAALAFRQELSSRMWAFARHLKKYPGDRPPDVIRVRAEIWLRRCLADNRLKAYGQQIYNAFAEVGWRAGLPEDILQQMRPTDGRIIAEFAATTINGRLPQEPSPQGSVAPETLSALLERAGKRCMAELRDLGDLPALKPTFDELLLEIDRAGYNSCADALAILVTWWRALARLEPQSPEWRQILSEATQAYDRLLDATQQEMGLGERSTAQDLMRALHRLNTQLENTLDAPSLAVAPPPPTPGNPVVARNDTASGSVHAAPESVASTHQTVGLFVDLLNLTDGTGASAISLTTNRTDCGIPGCYQLATVLDAIERYAQSLGSVATRRAVDFPRGCPAVQLCESRGYVMAPVSSGSTKQGTDDQVLIAHMTKVALAFKSVSHFILVSGDIDFQPISDAFLSVGKYVHVICRTASAPRREKIARLLRMYPGQFTFVTVEELLEGA